MKDDKHRGEGKTADAEKKDHPAKGSRQDRLKQALRENLKRRKSQARGRGDGTMTPAKNDELSPRDVQNKPRE